MHLLRALISILALLLIALPIAAQEAAPRQETAPPPPAAAAEDLPPVPQGVEVLARGPVHEAFATPAADPVPTKPVSKRPPNPMEEMPPTEQPEGEVIWIGGYWAWDDERNDFLWVSGTWRTPPPGKTWVAGYWKEEGEQWRWVPGFWTAADNDEQGSKQLTYLPAPPAEPEVAKPGEPPAADSFYVPGHWVWHDAGPVVIDGREVYREASYVWKAGYWARVQPGYVWVAAHYRWTPSGYLYVPGYWDLAIAKRGVLYAPVVFDTVVVGPGFVYTPAYVVSDTILIDAMFIRPTYCHYYFGDYYGVAYRDLGYESCIVYSRRRYDPIFVYAVWEHRHEPAWFSFHLDICLARHAGRAPCPPRTLIQQNTIIQNNITNVNVVNNTTNINRTSVNNNQVLVPSSQLAAAKGVKTVPLDKTARLQAKQQSQAIKQVALKRNTVEAPVAGGAPSRPKVANLSLPPAPSGSPRTKTPSAAKGPAIARPASSFPSPTANKPAPGHTDARTTSPVKSPARSAPPPMRAHSPVGRTVNPATPGNSNIPGASATAKPLTRPSSAGPLAPTRQPAQAGQGAQAAPPSQPRSRPTSQAVPPLRNAPTKTTAPRAPAQTQKRRPPSTSPSDSSSGEPNNRRSKPS